jgi:hypothetical protein
MCVMVCSHVCDGILACVWGRSCRRLIDVVPLWLSLITEHPRQHCAALLGRAQAPRRREYFLFKGADGLICFVVQPVSAGGLDVSKVDRM